MDNGKTTYSVEELKIKGNECVKEGKFIEAVLHYTHAIKMDPTNYILYSNRSFAFFKLDQLYLSLQDANETIKLQPQWAKGYFRRAQVESASALFDEAFESYTKALQLDPSNQEIMESITKLTIRQKAKLQGDRNTIWICTCIGFIIGITVVVLDNTMTSKPSLSNPMNMVLFSIAVAGLGWAIGYVVTLVNKWHDEKSILAPANLDTNKTSEEEPVVPERKKYSKAQARQRYKQGKA